MPERGDGDLLAAEYVLGVLDQKEREDTARRLETDPAFARTVDNWEVNLAPLAGAYASIEPPAQVKRAMDARLFSSTAIPTPSNASAGSWWSSLAFWRGLTAATAAALAIAVAVPALRQPTETTDARYMATLAAEASDVRYAAMYDQHDGKIALAHISGAKAADRDFELWMIEGTNAPISMGVIPSGEMISIRITPELKAKLAAGAVLAISLEPLGGSPTGEPTGPVVAAGDLKSI
ncbi:MAG: anti-sigma factor [Rhizobiaceae bacterium]